MLAVLRQEPEAGERPWIAKIKGRDPRFGLDREFIPAMRDMSQARVSMAGRKYGMVLEWMMDDGLYEACLYSGKGRKRSESRNFFEVVNGEIVWLSNEEAAAKIPPRSR